MARRPEGGGRLTSAASGSLAADAAAAIHLAYQGYQAEFYAVTRRAKVRFGNCDWPGYLPAQGMISYGDQIWSHKIIKIR